MLSHVNLFSGANDVHQDTLCNETILRLENLFDETISLEVILANRRKADKNKKPYNLRMEYAFQCLFLFPSSEEQKATWKIQSAKPDYTDRRYKFTKNLPSHINPLIQGRVLTRTRLKRR